MNPANQAELSGGFDWLDSGWVQRNVWPVVVAAVVTAVLAVLIVFSSQETWSLLAVGHGLFPENYYPLTALVIIIGTTYGQFVGFAIGCLLVTHVINWFWKGGETVLKIAVSVVLFGMGLIPVIVYHMTFGSLAGLPRAGLEEWIVRNHPDAQSLLFGMHTLIDALPPIFMAIGVVMVWVFGERHFRNRNMMALFITAVMMMSLALSFSLGIHSIMAKINLG